MNLLSRLILLCVVFSFISCNEDQENESLIVLENIEGFVQKGPFLNGTSIVFSELSENLQPTGKNYYSQIIDNFGSFQLNNVEVISTYVELIANGFYFNEVENNQSAAPLTLYALSNVESKGSLNVNVLSTLEKRRVIYLVENGVKFAAAKQQAQSEILSIFEIEDQNLVESELMDITKEGDEHAILLAISLILQGNLSVAELSELIANFAADINDDGVLNSQNIGSRLINNAKSLDLFAVRSNIEERYEDLGLNVVVPDFEKYVNEFIENTDFVFDGFVEFPSLGKHGLNLLDSSVAEYDEGSYSLHALVPDGHTLEVTIRGKSWSFPGFQENTGWSFSEWNEIQESRVFSSTRAGSIDFNILLEPSNDTLYIPYHDTYFYVRDLVGETVVSSWNKKAQLKL